MAKKKLRKIHVDGDDYLYRFNTSYGRTDDPSNPWHCRDTFIAYLEGQKQSPLNIHFTTWEDPAIGGPLRTGLPIVLGKEETGGVNLHAPKWAAELIRGARKQGWKPENERKRSPFVIADGLALLEKIGHPTR